MNITVIYNSSDSDEPSDQDTKKSAQEVAEALGAALFPITKSQIENIKSIKADLVFNLIEWTGHEAKYASQVVEILNELKMPYTGSGIYGLDVSNDKVKMKQKFDELGIPTPRYQIYDKEFIANNLQFPVIAKLASEHCSIGLDETNIVFNTESLREKIIDLRSQYDMPILVEEFIDGEEVHVSVLDKEGAPWVLPPDRIVFDESGKKSILSHNAKWEGGKINSNWAEFEEYDKELKSQIIDASTKCYIGLGGRSYCRIDIRVKGDDFYILEINNNPGIDWDEDNALCHSAKKAGFADFKSLLTHIVNDALKY
ncbi:MAG: ATP-grasp domain-containing protein [Candidatus Amesbacteria bacterium]|nr:ATP-grasp domain-containing protein [Candidatus Amesbacteria bacterium]